MRKTAILPLVPLLRGGAEVAFKDNVLSAYWPAGSKTLQLIAYLAGTATQNP